MKFKLAVIALGLALQSATVSASTVQDARQLIASGDAGIALVQLDRWLAEHPKDADARFMRGMALSQLDRRPEAIRAFTELIKDVPQYPEPYNNLGVLLAGMGEYAKARTAFETALAKNPQYTAAQQNLGDVNVALAMQSYQQVLAKDPANAVAQAKLDLLRSLHGAAAVPVPAAPPPAAAAAPAAQAQAATATPVTVSAPAPNAEREAAAKAAAAAVSDWVDAWTKQDAERFLGHYAEDFVPPEGVPLKQWRKDRRLSITAPKKIDLKLEDVKFSMAGTQSARISFREIYRSNLSSKVRNRALELQNRNGAWKIVAEQVTVLSSKPQSKPAPAAVAAKPATEPAGAPTAKP
jgi:tetratricopeptide (TPR) repeat protein